MRDDAQTLPGRIPLNRRDPVGEQRHVAAHAVDQEAADHRRIASLENRMGTDDAGNDPAAVDVADQHHRHVRGAGKPHVGDVVGAQIDFRGRSRPLHQHDVSFGLQPRKTLQHRRHQRRLDGLEFSRLRAAPHPPLHNDLGADLALRLQQYGIHVNAGRNAARARLQRLRPPDLAAILRHRRVVRHVLRLERTHPQPAIAQQPAQSRHDQRFANVGAGAHEHEGGNGSLGTRD